MSVWGGYGSSHSVCLPKQAQSLNPPHFNNSLGILSSPPPAGLSVHAEVYTHTQLGAKPNAFHKKGLHHKDHFYFSMPLINSACCPVGSNFKIAFTSLKGSPLFTFWAPKSLQMVTAAMKLKDAYSLDGKL